MSQCGIGWILRDENSDVSMGPKLWAMSCIDLRRRFLEPRFSFHGRQANEYADCIDYDPWDKKNIASKTN